MSIKTETKVSAHSLQEVRRSLNIRITLLARELRRSFDQGARATGRTRAQYQMIGAIWSRQGATQRQIAQLLDVGDVTAGRTIDRLCEEGLVERRQEAGDKRAYRLYLTPAATAILEELDRIATEEEDRYFAGLSLDELTRLRELLDRVSSNLGSS